MTTLVAKNEFHMYFVDFHMFFLEIKKTLNFFKFPPIYSLKDFFLKMVNRFFGVKDMNVYCQRKY